MTSMESGERFLADVAPLIENGISAALQTPDPHSEGLYDAMRYATFSGGKRLRPLLVLSAARAAGGSMAAALPGAVAIELIHTYSLIHDDLPAMDNDDFRRGRPTLHRVKGEALAILAGDGLLTLAFEVLAQATAAGVPPERVVQAVAVLSRAAGPKGMVAGQAADIDGDAPFTMEQLQYLHSHKTAALFEAAASLGPILGTADPDVVDVLAQFGRSFGLGYQIVDDLEDQEKDAGRMTYPALAGAATAAENARRYFDQASAIALRFPQGDALAVLTNMVRSRLDSPVH